MGRELHAQPCPWCGSPAHCLTVHVDDLVGKMEQVHCCGHAPNRRCQAQGPVRLSTEDAVRAWNKVAVDAAFGAGSLGPPSPPRPERRRDWG